MKNLKTSLLNRAPKLLNASLKLALGRDIKSVVENLSELKGVPQKIGQLLSMDVTQYISEDFKEKLRPLQGEGMAMGHEVILAIVQSQLSSDQFSAIEQFERKCIGAGSIGQVHRARLNQLPVVFKVQYPGIEKTIEADMALFKPLASIYEFIRPQSKDLSILIKEARLMLLNEMDYKKEAENLIFFKNILKEDDRFLVPTLLGEYSSKVTLCMEYAEGDPLGSFIKTASVQTKNNIANALLDLFIDEFFLYGKVQTDPNFANYLINSNEQIVLLDFGAVKDFDDSFRKDYVRLLVAAYEGNREEIIKLGEQFGLVDRRDTPEAIDLFVSFMEDVLSYFHQELNPVDFKKEAITKKLMETGWKLWKEQRISSPNAHLVFLHRKLGGLFSLLKEMQVEINLVPFWKKIIQSE